MLTLTREATGTTLVPRDDVHVGDTIDFFGEFHKIERIITPSGPAVDAGILPADRIALADGGTWQLTLASPLVPVLRRGGDR